MLTQNDTSYLTSLVSKKQRNKWDNGIDKQLIASTKATTWTDLDEKEMIIESAHGIIGCMFMFHK